MLALGAQVLSEPVGGPETWKTAATRYQGSLASSRFVVLSYKCLWQNKVGQRC